MSQGDQIKRGDGGGHLEETVRLGEPTELLNTPNAGSTEPHPRKATEVRGTPSTSKARETPRAGVGEVFAGRFEVESVLGEGGMGRVYLASDRQVNGRQVALKVLLAHLSENARFRSLFFQEIDAATRFVSEHVIQVRDTGQLDNGKLFLTMDYVEGESLDKVLRREGTLPVRHALEITRQILLGLGSGHAKGYIHRDLKPSNVMLAARTLKTEANPHGVAVRLLDFGIAGLAAKIDHKLLAGTPFYMSPEQLLGEEVDLRSDLFTVGIVLFEMLAGERPFQGKTLKELTTAALESNLHQKIHELEQVPKSVRGILQKALHKKRDLRFLSAEEFVHAIERSKAYRAVGKAPAWTTMLATAAVVGMVGEGAYIFSNMFGVVEARVGDLGSRFDANEAVADVRDKLNSDWQKRLDAANLHNEATITELKKQLSENDEARGGLALELSEERNRLGVLSSEKNQLAADMDHAASAIRNHEQSLLDKSLEISELKRDLMKYSYESRQEVKDAVAFDEVGEHLLNGSYSFAANRLEKAQQAPNSHLRIGAGAGGDLIQALVNGFTALQQLSDSGDVDADRLIDARDDCLARARSMVDDFETMAGAWIEFAQQEGGVVPPRQKRAEQLVESLATMVQEAEAKVSERHVADRDRLLDDPLECDPHDVIQHGKLHPCEHAKDVLELYADRLAEDVEPGDGSLDLEALRSFPNLPEWKVQLTGDGDEIEAVPLELKARVLEYAWALQWYVDRKDPDAPPEALDAPLEHEGRPRMDWRAQLRLQLRIWAAAKKSGKNPMLSAGRAYYRGETQRWYMDSAESYDESCRWKVKRVLFGKGKVTPIPMEYSLDERGAVARAEQRLFSLQATSGVQVADWSAASAEEIPLTLGFTLEELQRFHDSTHDRPLECLVVSDGEKSFWVSPEVGLVLEEEGGAPLLQLIYFERE